MATQNGPMNFSAAQIAAAQVDQTNQLTAAYFAAAILGLLALFTSFHWVGLVLQSCEPKTQGPFTGRVVLTAR
jgi:putative methionine-R-sulfoxide reductase with GAF domain